MFIDYLTLMLVNVTAALVGVAFFFWKGMDGPPRQGDAVASPDRQPWAAVFAATGLVLLLTGLHLSLTWPITEIKGTNLRFANGAFGESAAMLGSVLLATALSLAKGWDLRPVSILAFFAGLAAAVIGVRIGNLGLTAAPAMTATGFILAGLGGLLTPIILCIPRAKMVRMVAAVLLLISAAMWAFTACGGYWMHLQMLSGPVK